MMGVHWLEGMKHILIWFSPSLVRGDETYILIWFSPSLVRGDETYIDLVFSL